MGAVVILIGYAAMGALLNESGGFYDRSVPLFAAAVAATAAAMFVPATPLGAAGFRRLAGLIYVLFAVLIDQHRWIAPVPGPAPTWLNDVTRAALILSVPLAAMAMPARPSARFIVAFRVLAAVSVVALVAWQLLIPIASPHPNVDVFQSDTAATKYFLRGIDPYVVHYRDLYDGKFHYEPGFLYFPGALFLYAPVRWLGGDIRLVHVIANVVSAAGIGALAAQYRASESVRWLFVLLWLSFPVTGFVIEQAWIDLLLVPCVWWTAWAIKRDQHLVTGLASGAALAIKQYACVAVAPLLFLELRRHGWRKTLPVVGVSAMVAAALIVPVAALDWHAFARSTITEHVDTPLRRDAYNVTIYLYREYHWLLPAVLRTILAATATTAAAVWLLLRRTPTVTDAAAAMTLVFATATLFGKWAFCNYYYWLASFVLLYVVTSLSPGDTIETA